MNHFVRLLKIIFVVCMPSCVFSFFVCVGQLVMLAELGRVQSSPSFTSPVADIAILRVR
jgi:hypothetical protein